MDDMILATRPDQTRRPPFNSGDRVRCTAIAGDEEIDKRLIGEEGTVTMLSWEAICAPDGQNPGWKVHVIFDGGASLGLLIEMGDQLERVEHTQEGTS